MRRNSWTSSRCQPPIGALLHHHRATIKPPPLVSCRTEPISFTFWCSGANLIPLRLCKSPPAGQPSLALVASWWWLCVHTVHWSDARSCFGHAWPHAPRGPAQGCAGRTRVSRATLLCQAKATIGLGQACRPRLCERDHALAFGLLAKDYLKVLSLFLE
jgi:hypothetical protein